MCDVGLLQVYLTFVKIITFKFDLNLQSNSLQTNINFLSKKALCNIRRTCLKNTANFLQIGLLPSISSTFYVQIFRTNVILAAFTTCTHNVQVTRKKLPKRPLYKKFVSKMLMKQRPGLQNCVSSFSIIIIHSVL